MQDQNKKSTGKQAESAFAKAGPYLNIGYFFIGGMLLFGYIGYKIDQSLDTKFIFLLAGLFLALGLGFYNMFKVLSQLNSKTKPKE